MILLNRGPKHGSLQEIPSSFGWEDDWVARIPPRRDVGAL